MWTARFTLSSGSWPGPKVERRLTERSMEIGARAEDEGAPELPVERWEDGAAEGDFTALDISRLSVESEAWLRRAEEGRRTGVISSEEESEEGCTERRLEEDRRMGVLSSDEESDEDRTASSEYSEPESEWPFSSTRLVARCDVSSVPESDRPRSSVALALMRS